MKKKYIRRLQNRTAELAIGASTLRSQGAKGVVGDARKYLKHIQLHRLRVRSEADFQRKLDLHTRRLQRSFPRRAQNWGAARKALNIFLRDVLYNAYLVDFYHLRGLEKWLEVPLDSHVATGIKKHARRDPPPRWHTIKGLKPEISERYQKAAQDIANARGTNRVHLDLDFWRQKKK
jgi:hypothetical protein